MSVLHGTATAALWLAAAIGATALLVAGKVLLDMATKEVTGQVERLPMLILKLALLRLPTEQRSRYQEDWQAELVFILKELDSRPVSRLVKGLRFAMSLLIQAARMRQALGVTTPSRLPKFIRLFASRLMSLLAISQGILGSFELAHTLGWDFTGGLILSGALVLLYSATRLIVGYAETQRRRRHSR